MRLDGIAGLKPDYDYRRQQGLPSEERIALGNPGLRWGIVNIDAGWFFDGIVSEDHHPETGGLLGDAAAERTSFLQASFAAAFSRD